MKRRAVQLTDYIFRFFEGLQKELQSPSEPTWADWREIPPESIESLFYSRLEGFWVDFSRDGLPIPWLKIAALTLVAWVRFNYPKTYQEPD